MIASLDAPRRRDRGVRRARATSPAVLFLAAASCVAAASSERATAQRTDAPTRAQLALALAVARTTANEAGFDSVNDARLIYQTTRAHEDTDGGRLAWLRLHSPCTNGGDCNRDGVVDALDADAADRPGLRSRWSRHLAATDRRPPEFPAGHPWNGDAWRALRATSLALVVDDVSTGVCDGAPVITWGNEHDFEHGRFAGSLVRHDCEAVNFGGTRRARASAPRALDSRRTLLAFALAPVLASL